MITSILYYVHRYIRLTIPYALILAVVIAVLPHMAYGPFWSYVIDNSEVSRVLSRIVSWELWSFLGLSSQRMGESALREHTS